MSGLRILIVDDEPNIRSLCSLILTRAGYTVDGASDGLAALERVRNVSYELVLLDINMPRMGGLELLKNLREMKIDLAAVILTSFGNTENAISSLRLEVKDFLLKPFDKDELLRVVGKAIEGKKLARERIRLEVLLPLFEVSRELLTEMDLQRLLKKIIHVVTGETHAAHAAIMLFNPETGRFTSQDESDFPMLDLYTLLVQRVVRGGHPIILSRDVAHLDDTVGKIMQARDVSAIISMPILSKRRIIGVLNACKQKGSSFDESDLELVSVLCSQAGIAIENARLFEEVKQKTDELRGAHFDSIRALAEALESKDAYTRGHSDRALKYAVAVGRRLELTLDRIEHLKYTAILHDIGKIGIPDVILNKPAKLTEEEYSIMKTHPEKGADIIRQIKYLEPVVPLVLSHQERYDGRGYPLGLKGDRIPLESRIVAVLDAYDAMTSDRIYRRAPGKEQAIQELKQNAGTQFDANVVGAFLEVLAESEDTDLVPT